MTGAGITDGIDLVIRKVIPVAGGMAGGSADAAASLVACNEAWGAGLSRAALEVLAAQLGSDVPFLLHGGNAVGGGRGETVSPVLARGSYHWVLATAHEGLSTKAVFAEFDRLNEDVLVPEPAVPDALLAALRAGDAEALGLALSNDLTEAALSLRPELEDTLAIGLEAGALGAILSGSGPTALFLAGERAAQPGHRLRPHQRRLLRGRRPVPRPGPGRPPRPDRPRTVRSGQVWRAASAAMPHRAHGQCDVSAGDLCRCQRPV